MPAILISFSFFQSEEDSENRTRRLKSYKTLFKEKGSKNFYWENTILRNTLNITKRKQVYYMMEISLQKDNMRL